ncbi:retrotransposon gag domain-containing protein [Artemisia annua]|uniref:Retrotransposon gag domain-containing protein n=1 Tax=Artemisia annua TaxID=35608 RepID=A0A2U1KRT8_ARTAN|nr:retrotransposon gag domain-containing protein [Artemisia annua]
MKVINAPEGIESAKGEEEENVAPEIHNLTHKKFLERNPRTFNRTEGTIRLCKGIEGVKHIFQCENCPKDDRIKFATCTFQGCTLGWWHTYVQEVGVNAAHSIFWGKLQRLMITEYCSRPELRTMEQEF